MYIYLLGKLTFSKADFQSPKEFLFAPKTFLFGSFGTFTLVTKISE